MFKKKKTVDKRITKSRMQIYNNQIFPKLDDKLYKRFS